jgi:hypothetical protein
MTTDRVPLPTYVLSLLLTRRGLRIAFMVLAVLSIGGVSIWSLGRITRPAQVDSVPYTILDPAWLTDKEWLLQANPMTGEPRTIQDAYRQMQLWLENDDTSRGQLGVMVEERFKEALRYQGQAAVFINDPNHPSCGGQPQEVCYQTFADNLVDALQDSSTPSQRLKVLTQYLALNEARFNTAQNLGVPTDTLALQIIKKFEYDLALYYERGTANGLSRSAQEAEDAAEEAP